MAATHDTDDRNSSKPHCPESILDSGVLCVARDSKSSQTAKGAVISGTVNSLVLSANLAVASESQISGSSAAL
eukprot:3712038-Amphidinium_carterae.1